MFFLLRGWNLEAQFVAKLKGDVADDHRVPAYEGAKSLYGLNRSLLIVSNYVVEGRVR